MQKFNRTYQGHLKRVTGYLMKTIAEGKERARERGMDKAELADNVLDLMCLKEGGSDSLSDEEMRDELFTFSE